MARIPFPSMVSKGWGLAYSRESNTHFISDGSNKIYEVKMSNPPTLKETHRIISEDGEPIYSLNELEMIGSSFWANIYLTSKIAIINPTTNIASTIDFEYLLSIANAINLKLKNRKLTRDECLNGIAYDSKLNIIVLTGKNWPVMFQVDVDFDVL